MSGFILTVDKQFPEGEWTVFHAAHLLSRAGFGGSPEDIRQLHALGLNEAVESLLRGDEESDLFPPPELSQPENLAEYRQTVKEAPDEMARREMFQEQRRIQRDEIRALRKWWLARMRYTTWPLREKMTLFWHGHFATSVEKTKVAYLMWQQNETLRSEALGSFRKLTKAISRDPAMMRYLDLQQSKREQPNENFARELMELFTLGEGVKYSETDVREAARALTGYRINQRTQQFAFQRKQFDNGRKTILGKTGQFNGDETIDIILDQPECAQFIVGKLWKYLAAEEPPEPMVQVLAQEFRVSGYDITKLLRNIFLSEEFYYPEVVRHQVKSPVQWIVQTSKALEAPLPESPVIENALAQMGQVLFAPQNVKGWDGGRAWITSATLLYRFNLAGTLVSSKDFKLAEKRRSIPIPIDRIAPKAAREDRAALCDELAFRMLNSQIEPAEKDRLLAFLAERGPDINDATVRDLLHLIMSTPDYQLT